MLSCFNVADYFIWLANETGSFISNLKLQIQKQWMKEYYESRADEENITDDQFGKINSAAW
ncbi:hypothetical protein [Nostoc sp.]|uniref:hypothetical protein n=1 Tax=Nostoc sp. TaxID=1180 RepID=UPI002FFBCB6D